MCGRGCGALAGDEKCHQRERGHFDHHRQARRDPQPCKACNRGPVRGLHAPPQTQWRIQRLRAQQPDGQRQHADIDKKGGPRTSDNALGGQACAAEGEPYRQRQLDTQRTHLQPGHKLWAAQGLVERAVDAKQQGWWQGHRQDGQVVLHFGAQRCGHLGPAQDGAGKQQDGHANHRSCRTQIQRLSQRTSHVPGLARSVKLCPDGHQGLKHADQRNVHTDKNRRAHGQGGQRRFAVAARHHGVGNAKGHDGQLPGKHRGGMPCDGRQLRHCSDQSAGFAGDGSGDGVDLGTCARLNNSR